jgi:LysM repeat protein
MVRRAIGRRAPASTGALVVAVMALSSCSSGLGGRTSATRETPLPPLPTVTTTTTPTTTIPPFYVVQKGDTLTSIAKKFHVSIAAIVAANKLANPDKVEAGQRLALPRPPPRAAPTTSVSPPPVASP